MASRGRTNQIKANRNKKKLLKSQKDHSDSKLPKKNREKRVECTTEMPDACTTGGEGTW